VDAIDSLADKSVSGRNDLLNLAGDELRLLVEVPADVAHLALQVLARLPDRALDDRALDGLAAAA